jgi:hypothetical protein
MNNFVHVEFEFSLKISLFELAPLNSSFEFSSAHIGFFEPVGVLSQSDVKSFYLLSKGNKFVFILIDLSLQFLVVINGVEPSGEFFSLFHQIVDFCIFCFVYFF